MNAPPFERAARLRRLLAPRSAVFIGGSNLEGAIANTRAKGFKGPIHVVNPVHETIAGIRCVRSVTDLREVPDLAFVAVPKEAVCDSLAALSGYGVGAAVCTSAGFSEIEGRGVQRQDALRRAAGAMPVLGPNCPGFANFLDNAVFMMDHFGDHEAAREGVAVISNGGAYLSDLGCARRSLAVGYLIGLGNQAMLTIADMLDALLDDPRVKAVNLYIESLRDVSALSRAALKAARREVPVVVVKGGRSTAGGRATATHTASLAGEAVVASALFARFGFLEAANPIEAIEMLKMLVSTRRPTGRRLAFATSSGSYAVLGADAAEAAGLEIPPLPAPAIEALRPQLPPFILPGNPLDISETQFASAARQAKLFDAYLAGDYDLAVLVMSFPPPGGWPPESWHDTAAAFAAAAARRGLAAAFVNSVPEDLPEDARRAMIENGMAPLMGLDHGMTAVAAAVRYAEKARDLKEIDPDALLLAEPPSETACMEIRLHEAAAKARLVKAGVSVPKGRVLSDRNQAVPDDLAYPLVLKALSPGLLHKTEAGAVALGIAGPDALSEALDAMSARLAVASYLVEEMVCDGIGEVLVGIRRVPEVGLAMTLAIGGVAVELLRDAATLILPAPRAAMAVALRELKLFPLLAGWRGRPQADVEAALDAIEALAAVAIAEGPAFEELEVNPLILRPKGKGAVAVDAIVTLRAPQN